MKIEAGKMQWWGRFRRWCNANRMRAKFKTLVLDFWRDFFNYHKFDEAAAKYLSPNFVNHDPYEPSNPKEYADFVRKDLGKLPPIEERPKLFVVAEGDLVIIGEIPREGDPQAKFSANLLRVKDGSSRTGIPDKPFPRRRRE